MIMNQFLEKLFEQYHLSDKDRHEVRQIYSLLPEEKQRNLITNFEILASRLKVIEYEILSEREILLGQWVDNVRNVIETLRKQKANNQSRLQIDDLKKQI